MPDALPLSVGRDRARRLSAYRDLHRGARMIVCGCGVSLTTLNRPDRFLTIGVNDVGRAFHPDYLILLDNARHLGPERFAYVENSGARTIFTQRPTLLPGRRDVVGFRLEQAGETPIRPLARPLARPLGACADILPFSAVNQMTPHAALCLALHMGAATVGLIGVDLTDHHFFAATGTHEWAAHLEALDARFAELGDAFAARGGRVFNLSAVSRLRAFPRMSLVDFAAMAPPTRSARRSTARPTAIVQPRRIVCYATTPRVGVPAILARCINGRTRDRARALWPADTYESGISFPGDLNWHESPGIAERELRDADVVILHGGRCDPRHEALLATKPVLTLAQGGPDGIDTRWVDRGLPGLVLGQHQATLPAFAGWRVVPSPVPLHEAAFRPERKQAAITLVYTPPARHDTYPDEHPLRWHGKGYTETMAVLDRLARRYPVRVIAARGRGVSHGAAMAAKRRAHIVIDECVTGSFHRSSLEGLAAGCVVVNAVAPGGAILDQLRLCAGDPEAAPFVHATLATLEPTLAALIDLGPEFLTVLGAEGRRWLARHWDFAAHWRRFWSPAIDAAIAWNGAPPPAG